MKHFGWTEDDILYEDHEQDWYEDDDYDTVAESNGQSQYEDFDWTEDDILYDNHEENWYEDYEYDKIAKSNGKSQYEDFDWNEEEEEEYEDETDF